MQLSELIAKTYKLAQRAEDEQTPAMLADLRRLHAEIGELLAAM